MAGYSTVIRYRRIIGDLSGAFGDLGTFLPYAAAVLGAGILEPAPVFAGFAAGYLLVAVFYRLPVAVQPMKAIGAMMIAGALTAYEVAWTGAAIGAVLLVLCLSPGLERVARAIPQSVVTGLQAGLGLMLGLAAFSLMRGDWLLSAAAMAVLALSLVWKRGPWALVVVLGAMLLVPETRSFETVLQSRDSGPLLGVATGFLAQLPLTLLNAVVLTAAILRSLYPDSRQRISERRLAATSGLLNLVLVPMGAMPMCHGAGGVVAHHRFGARTWLAPALLAAICAAAALSGERMIGLLAAIPLPVVGALLIYASLDLIISRRLFDARPDCRPVIAVSAVATFAGGAFAGLVAGLAAEALRVYLRRAFRSPEDFRN